MSLHAAMWALHGHLDYIAPFRSLPSRRGSDGAPDPDRSVEPAVRPEPHRGGQPTIAPSSLSVRSADGDAHPDPTFGVSDIAATSVAQTP